MSGRVTVIIAAYNCALYVRESIDSILTQTYQDIELLVCDDCSTDNTWAILNEYTDNRIKLFRNNRNQGVVYTRNFLFSQSSGEFILIQDADDWSEVCRIEKLLEIFQSYSVLSCVSAHYRVKSGISNEVLSDRESGFVSLKDCLNPPFMPATIMFHRKIYEDLGGYNNFFSRLFAEDLYWIIRVVDKYQTYYLNTPLYYYRFNPESLTNSIIEEEKFVTIELIQQLIEQRLVAKTDWLEQQNTKEIEMFTAKLLNNKSWLSEQYRVAAAVQCDGKKFRLSIALISKAFMNNPLNFSVYRTFFYIAKSQAVSWIK